MGRPLVRGACLRRLLLPAVPAVGGDVLADLDVSHHALRVIRLARGEHVRIADGAGHVAVAELVGVEDGRARLRVLETLEATAVAARVVLLGVPRHALLEEALQLGTEAGVTRFVLVRATRSPGGDPRADRLDRVLRAAVTQCGRPDLPRIDGPSTLAQALSDPSLEGLQRWVALPGASGQAAEGPAAVAVGPEGGWSPEEVDQLLAAGFAPLGLGPWTLRTPTAVAVAMGALSRSG